MAPDPYIRFRNPDDLGLRPPDANMYTTPAISIVKPTGIGLNEDPAVIHADVDDQFVHVEVGNKGTQDAERDRDRLGLRLRDHGRILASLGGSLRPLARRVTIPAGAPGRRRPSSSTGSRRPPSSAAPSATSASAPTSSSTQPTRSRTPTSPARSRTSDIFTNIRHGQRNMTLLPKPVTLRGSMDFDLAIANPDAREAQEFRFEVREVRGRFERNEIAHLRRTTGSTPSSRRASCCRAPTARSR